MKRRDFLKQSAIAGIAAATPYRAYPSNSKRGAKPAGKP